jgi:hypothetical protein
MTILSAGSPALETAQGSRSGLVECSANEKGKEPLWPGGRRQPPHQVGPRPLGRLAVAASKTRFLASSRSSAEVDPVPLDCVDAGSADPPAAGPVITAAALDVAGTRRCPIWPLVITEVRLDYGERWLWAGQA